MTANLLLDRLSPQRSRPDPQSASASPTCSGATIRSRPPHLVLTLILVSQLMVILDGTIVNIALQDIRADLDFSPTGLSWVVNAYNLTFGGLLLLGARAGDLLGRRRVFLAGIALFTLASLAGGFAENSARCSPRERSRASAARSRRRPRWPY